jgi:hypothetical protein
VLSGHTAKVIDNVHWSAALVVEDADGRIGQEYTLHTACASSQSCRADNREHPPDCRLAGGPAGGANPSHRAKL